MRMLRRSVVLLALPLLLPLGVPAAVSGQQAPELTEWHVPWEVSRPRDPYLGPDGRVWFVGQRSDYAAVLDPASGEFEKFELGEGVGPHNLIVDGQGIVWYAGNRQAHIGRLDPATGNIDRFDMPTPAARDPHTLTFAADGSIWFTVQNGNFVGHFDPETGETRLVEAPEVTGSRSTSSRPYGIKMDSNDEPWIVLFNTNLVAHVDPATYEMTTYELPEGARPRRIEITSDDMIWYGDYARGYLGRLDPATGEVTEWAAPAGEESRPYGMARDTDDRIWFVETGVRPNTFVGFDPTTEEFFSVTEVESGAGSIRHMFLDEDANTIWFGTDMNTVGKAVVPPRVRPVS